MRNALALTVAFLLLAQPAFAQPALDPELATRAPLKEIARVRAVTPFCKFVVERASIAVDDAFDGDTRIAFLVADLSSVDLESSYFRKYQAMSIFDRRYRDLRGGILEGETAIDELRQRAATSTNVEEREALTNFADALGGALSRQHKILRDLNGFLAYVAAVQPPEDRLGIEFTRSQVGGFIAAPGTLTYAAQDAARDFTDRSRPAYDDEKRAAGYAAAAFKRCAAALPDALSDGTTPASDPVTDSP